MTFLSLVLFVLEPAYESPQDVFRRAESLYQEERYLEAAEAYESIRELGIEDGVLYYNLGNAYFKAGRLGLAVLNYERAQKLLPADEDVRANLAFASELVSEAVEPLPLPLLVSWAVDLYRSTSTNALARLLSLSFLVAGISVSLLLSERWSGLRNAALATLIVTGVLALASGTSLAFKLSAESGRVEAVVVSENAYVRSGPGETSPRLAEIHEGLKVRVLGAREGWLQVSLANGITGWIPAEQLEEI
jgi:tetratricopeptide (TPR) repeat protein